VLMANTTEHISLRLPSDLLAKLDHMAAEEGRSRANLIVHRLQQDACQVKGTTGGEPGIGYDALVGNVGPIAGIERSMPLGLDGPSPDGGEIQIAGLNPRAEGTKAAGCKECGALTGHQKWCKA
jgi:hypothetical protein